jgi:predicted nicotinamide N-methyase
MDSSNPEPGSSNLVNYTSSENSQDEESRAESSERDLSPGSPGPSCSRSYLQRGEISKESLDSSLEFSDDESICRSPAKSPLKRSRLTPGLHRKKRLDLDSEDGPGADGEPSSESRLPTDQDFQFTEPKFRKKKFIFHHFLRSTSGGCVPDKSKDPVEVTIPEQLAASYGLYIWPSSPVLAWYIWLHQETLVDKRVLELGAGTALPGLLSAKLGCQVILSDSLNLPHCLENCKEGVRLNNLEDRVSVQPLTWGSFSLQTLRFQGRVDLLLGSDLFFDPDVFEPLLVTVSWILRNNPGSEFICTVQERAADWSIEALLLKWKLSCSYVYPADFLRGTGINESDLTGNHQIFILRITSNHGE